MFADLLIGLGHLVLGWLGWSLSHYWLHRSWHGQVISGRGPKLMKLIVEGEELHHVIYDARPPELARDPKAKSVTFPIVLALPVMIPIVIAWGWNLGLVAGIGFAIGSFGAMLIDDQTHRRSHPRVDANGYARGNFLALVHDTHHDSFLRLRATGEGEVCNYGFCTGVIWDVVFGTWRQPPSNRILSKGEAS